MQPICEGFQKGIDKPCVNSIGEKFDFCELPEMFRCIEFVRRNEPTLSYSAIQNSYCKRKLYYSYICGIQLIVKPLPMRLGSIASDILNYLHDETGKTLFPNLDEFKNEEGELPYQIQAMIGLFRGYLDKEFNIRGKIQPRFEWREDGYPNIIGYGDLAIYNDAIAYEFKYSSRPEAYQKKFIIQDQLATQFLGMPQIERITLRTFQVPQLRLAKNETVKEYKERVYLDFLSRPLHYMHDTHYWRNEFDYDEIREKYKMIASEIQRYIEMGGKKYFYQSNGPSTCFADNTGIGTFNCEYLPICESGVVSDQIYKKREVK